MKRKSLLILVLVVAVAVVATRMAAQNDAGEVDELSLMTVTVRLDRQNDIYYQLAQRLEDCASADEPTVSDGEFCAFCDGVNCLVRDEMLSGLFERAHIPEGTVELLGELMGTTAKYGMEVMQPSTLSEETLESFVECAYSLAEHCDRGREGTLAYCVSAQDFESEAYRDAETQVKKLLAKLDELLG